MFWPSMTKNYIFTATVSYLLKISSAHLLSPRKKICHEWEHGVIFFKETISTHIRTAPSRNTINKISEVQNMMSKDWQNYPLYFFFIIHQFLSLMILLGFIICPNNSHAPLFYLLLTTGISPSDLQFPFRIHMVLFVCLFKAYQVELCGYRTGTTN